jgi:hypothetical protein
LEFHETMKKNGTQKWGEKVMGQGEHERLSLIKRVVLFWCCSRGIFVTELDCQLGRCCKAMVLGTSAIFTLRLLLLLGCLIGTKCSLMVLLMVLLDMVFGAVVG